MGAGRPAAAGQAVAAVGIEVEIGPHEGLSPAGVVRLALPRDDTVFCTWLVTSEQDYLIERAGVLPPAKLNELDNALSLASTDASATG